MFYFKETHTQISNYPDIPQLPPHINKYKKLPFRNGTPNMQVKNLVDNQNCPTR